MLVIPTREDTARVGQGGQVALPFVASLVAAAIGVTGIFVIIAVNLEASGASVHFSRQER